jgi:hypothetical protein
MIKILKEGSDPHDLSFFEALDFTHDPHMHIISQEVPTTYFMTRATFLCEICSRPNLIDS